MRRWAYVALFLVLVFGVAVAVIGQQAGTGADAVANASLAYFTTPGDSTSRLLAVVPHLYNGTTWDRMRSAGATGVLAVGGAAASGATSTGNPVLSGGIFNTTLPSVTNGQAVSLQMTSAGGAIFSAAPDINGQTALSTALTSTLGATVYNIKTAAGNLYGYDVYNPAAAACFLQVFATTSGSITLGTTAPTLSIGIPTVARAEKQGTIALLTSTTGFAAASTTTATGNTTCATANIANFFYK